MKLWLCDVRVKDDKTEGNLILESEGKKKDFLIKQDQDVKIILK